MNILVAYQGVGESDHPGVFKAFESLLGEGRVGRHVPFFWRSNRTPGDWDNFWSQLSECIVAERIDWVLLHQFHDRDIMIGDGLRRVKAAAPGVRIATSLGDPFCRFTHRVPLSFVEAARASDLVFLTGLGYLARQLGRAGVRNIVWMPLGYCDVRFGKTQPVPSADREGIVFVGNRRLGRNPSHELFWNGLKRIRLVKALSRRYGRRFHLYGKGWDGLVSARGVLPFDRQGEIYGGAKVVFGGYPGVTYEYYTSNRHFIAMSEGAVMVDYRVKGVEEFLKPETHWLLYGNESELYEQIDGVLNDGDGEMMAERGRAYVREHFSKKKLMSDMVNLWSEFDQGRSESGEAPPPVLPYVLPEFRNRIMAERFVRHWSG